MKTKVKQPTSPTVEQNGNSIWNNVANSIKREYFAVMRKPKEGQSELTYGIAKVIMGSEPPNDPFQNILWWAEAEERLAVIHADALIKALNDKLMINVTPGAADTPKEKAVELVDKFLEYADYANEYFSVKCALIAVDEILKEVLPIGARNGEERTKEIYWQQVKTELQNLYYE